MLKFESNLVRGLTACAVTLAMLGATGCSAGHTETEQATLHKSGQALTTAQCSYFAEGDKVTICHHTSSARNPYVIIKTNIASCGGHQAHQGDYVAVGDPSCNGQGCFPEGAPWDGSVECCEGLAPVNGQCTATCRPSTPATCQGDLTNIGQGDFRIQFTVSTNQTGIISVLSQRADCVGTGSPPGGWWSIRLTPDASDNTKSVVGVETAGMNYTVLYGTRQINDGLPHTVVVQRTSGVLTITTDCLPDGSGESLSYLGDLGGARLTTNDVCTGLDGTQALNGTLGGECVSHAN